MKMYVKHPRSESALLAKHASLQGKAVFVKLDLQFPRHRLALELTILSLPFRPLLFAGRRWRTDASSCHAGSFLTGGFGSDHSRL